MQNKGSRAFAALPGSVDEKAQRFNSGKTRAVRMWLSGESVPTPAKRTEIEEGGGPPAAWWLEPVADADAALPALEPTAPPVAGAATPAAVASEADAMLADVQAMRAYVSALQGSDPAEKIRMLERITAMIVGLSKMRGVLMSERQILASPAWLVVEQRMLDALAPWPDALRMVGEALADLRAS